MNQEQKAFLDSAVTEAVKANHPFAQMAACEAALESNYGKSQLALDARNLFGMKQHTHPVYGTMTLPTREYLNGEWQTVGAGWVSYPDLRSCFCDRLATLERLASVYPHYKAALDAPDAQTYIREVSRTWSTDPDRASKVLSIYQEYAASQPFVIS